MLKGFRSFILRGNVVELAVAVAVGAAFTAVIKAIVDGVVNPLIAAVFGKPNLDDLWSFTINGAEFRLGLVVNALVNFLLVAAVIYFVIVVPINRVRNLPLLRGDEPEEVPEDIALLRQIRDALSTQP